MLYISLYQLLRFRRRKILNGARWKKFHEMRIQFCRGYLHKINNSIVRKSLYHFELKDFGYNKRFI